MRVPAGVGGALPPCPVPVVDSVAVAAVTKAGVPSEVAPLVNWLAGLSVIAALIAILVGWAERDDTAAEPSQGDAHPDMSEPTLRPAERRRKQPIRGPVPRSGEGGPE